MLLNARQEEILRQVRSGAGERIEELCQKYGVSLPTMRRDLTRLEEMGLIRRVRGGALPLGQDIPLPPPEDREHQRLEEKRRIGAAAAALVLDGSVIIVDAGSTTKQMVPHLACKRNLTVITRDLQVATQLTAFPQIEVICVGGTIGRGQAVSGSLALRFVEQFYADQIFLGCMSITPTGGIWTSSGEEALVKHESIRRSQQCIVLADSSKVGRSGGTFVAPTKEAHLFISDTGVGDSAREEFAAVGLTVRLV